MINLIPSCPAADLPAGNHRAKGRSRRQVASRGLWRALSACLGAGATKPERPGGTPMDRGSLPLNGRELGRPAVFASPCLAALKKPVCRLCKSEPDFLLAAVFLRPSMRSLWMWLEGEGGLWLLQSAHAQEHWICLGHQPLTPAQSCQLCMCIKITCLLKELSLLSCAPVHQAQGASEHGQRATA